MVERIEMRVALLFIFALHIFVLLEFSIEFALTPQYILEYNYNWNSTLWIVCLFNLCSLPLIIDFYKNFTKMPYFHQLNKAQN